MLTISVDYLMERAVARDYFSGALTPEWPPHPCRLFSAMLASWGGEDENEPEAAALKWLEIQHPPEIAACEVKPSEAVSLYSAPSDWMKNFKQEKKTEHHFPRVALSNPRVFFTWKEIDRKELAEHRRALETIVGRIPYLGNSMSPVMVSLCDSSPDIVNPVFYVPKEDGNMSLRVAGEGRFDDLCRTYKDSKGQSSEIAYSRQIFYEKIKKEKEEISHPPRSRIFDDNPDNAIVLRLSPDSQQSSLPYLRHCHKAVDVLRRAMIAKANELNVSAETKELVSGHPAGSSLLTEKPHIARIPLANVGWQHSDGKVLGFALLLPPKLPKQIVHEIKRVAEKIESLKAGGFGIWNVEVTDPDYDGSKSIRPHRYFDKSKKWATVTPTQFETPPNRRNSVQSYKILHRSFERQELPSPVFGLSRQSQHSRFPGVPRSGDFKVLRRDADRRPWTHLTVEFPEPVKGPIVVGALRFFGMGLMMPLPDANEK